MLLLVRSSCGAGGAKHASLSIYLLLLLLRRVTFNIAGPASRQLETLSAKKKAVAGAIGLGAATSLLLAPGADAATEAMQLAAGDNRFGIIATIVLIALGWYVLYFCAPSRPKVLSADFGSHLLLCRVTFNIAGPASRQASPCALSPPLAGGATLQLAHCWPTNLFSVTWRA